MRELLSILVYGRLGGNPRSWLHSSAVLEADPFDELADLVHAAISLPSPLRSHGQLVGEGQHREAG